jgi:dihydrofolate synthase/folylpolyglutamate synthase
MRRLLRLLGNPHQCLRAVHIAGSKGKGSTCVFAANILKEAGFSVGLYTSPHLMDVRERIRILQFTEKELISKRDFTRLIERIKPFAERLRETKSGGLTYYEILTVLAFLYFKEKKCDFVVLETGIGGRLDATNVVSSLVCAITPVSYEHTRVLGTTLKEIAGEKAGIIKAVHSSQLTVHRPQVVITAPQKKAVLAVIKRRAAEVGARLVEVGSSEYRGLKTGLLGEHQMVNAAVAVRCVKALADYGVRVSSAAIRRGLKKTRWPARMQVISHRPRVILDAAHNRASAFALKKAVLKSFKFRDLILVFGTSQDKDIRGILKELAPLASRVILTKARHPRAMQPERIGTFIKNRDVILTDNAKRALKTAVQNAGARDLVLICGSLFLAAEVLGGQRGKYDAIR